jgi:hypothetical protein
MKHFWILSIALLTLLGCNNPLGKDCRVTVPLYISDISLPDTTCFNAWITIDIEISYPSSGYGYDGPIVLPSGEGCDIRAYGERDYCMHASQMPFSRKYAIIIRPDKRGEYIVKAFKGLKYTCADTMYVK